MVRVLIYFLLLTSAYAGIETSVPAGRPDFKFLKLAIAPGQVAVSGGGIALPASAGDLIGIPQAMALNRDFRLGISHAELAEQTGASLGGAYLVLPGAGLSYSLVTRYLDYDDLQGYDEDGFSSGDFAAYAYTLEAGVSGVLGSLEWGLQGGYARYDIETESSHAGFGNAGVSLNLPHNLRVAWVLSNLGYGTPFVNRPVILPLTLQTGIAHHLKIGNRFAWNSFMDFRRRNDESGVYIPGAEVVYAKILSLRSGYALGEKRPVVTGGFGVNLSPLRIAYAYRGHEALAGAHFLSFETLF